MDSKHICKPLKQKLKPKFAKELAMPVCKLPQKQYDLKVDKNV